MAYVEKAGVFCAIAAIQLLGMPAATVAAAPEDEPDVPVTSLLAGDPEVLLKNARDRVAELIDGVDKLNTRQAGELADAFDKHWEAVFAIALRLAEENRQLERENDMLQMERNELMQTRFDAEQALTKTADSLALLRQELQTLQKQLPKPRKDREVLYGELSSSADQLYRVASELKQLHLEEQSPPKVDGVVLAAKSGLVEISLGSDDGLRVGHSLEVFRTTPKPVYLGRIEIVMLKSDRSVGKVLPDFSKGKIEKGDRVATSLQGNDR